MSFLLWQALLLAELPILKGRALLKELGPLGDNGVSRLQTHPSLSDSERKRLEGFDPSKARTAEKLGIETLDHRDYPQQLKEWPQNPLGLFVWGDWACAHRPTVGIVGTRAASTYGKAVAMKFAESLAEAGATIVSGGAIGIDGAAHRGALGAEGKTIAVLAGGVDKLYPAIHRGLFQQIREGGGCLVSQFACGAKPDAYRFLARNYVIAALSQVLIVVEAPERSGAIHTANRANELGRQVFVVPANIENMSFRGSHALIRDGATLLDHPDQVISALDLEKPATKVMAPPVGEIPTKIMSVLTTTPLAIEFILERTGLSMQEVASELTLLELEGRILHDAGGYAIKP